MNKATARLDPLIYEFDTEEEATSYDRWFRAKVQEALDDPSPSIPHDEVRARIEAAVERQRKARAGA
ncbi:hypothetical protein AXE65_00540 [Ventosimonas gracilis]|uniref:Stability determinant domain-containing protein n=1 Tax=Ventosimonas gracilis TaxID=1680762 RepID=A0A139SUB9_9GAMM|nr:hypothetical protein [Ventosimonas gracilis]KXU38041.1 hypothetical protein AXE65_00540 [Ventosimonas gracilis]